MTHVREIILVAILIGVWITVVQNFLILDMVGEITEWITWWLSPTNAPL